jgi:hypothetical protein
LTVTKESEKSVTSITVEGKLSALKMEKAGSSETVLTFYETTWSYIQKTATFIFTAVRTSKLTI